MKPLAKLGEKFSEFAKKLSKKFKPKKKKKTKVGGKNDSKPASNNNNDGNKKDDEDNKGAPPAWKGTADYSSVKDPKDLINTKSTPRQVREMKEVNRKHNDGVLRSDMDGEPMVDSQKSMKGVTPAQNEAQVDHIVPVSKGGTRTNSNLRLTTRKKIEINGINNV